MFVSADPTLCDRCSPMFQGSFTKWRKSTHDHHASIQSLEEAANRNCIICRDVWKDLMKRSNFDRQTLCVATASKNQITTYSMDEGHVCVHYHVYGLGGLQHQSYRCLETQRKSALQPCRVQTLCTDVKQ